MDLVILECQLTEDSCACMKILFNFRLLWDIIVKESRCKLQIDLLFMDIMACSIAFFYCLCFILVVYGKLYDLVELMVDWLTRVAHLM